MHPVTTHFIRYRETPTSGLAFEQTSHGLSFNGVAEVLVADGYTCHEIEGVYAADEAAGSWKDVSRDVADAVGEIVAATDGYDDLSRAVRTFLHNASWYVGNGPRPRDPNAEHRQTPFDVGVATGRRAA